MNNSSPMRLRKRGSNWRHAENQDDRHENLAEAFFDQKGKMRTEQVISNRKRSGSTTAGVIRITFAQLAREAVCFFGVARLAKCHRSFVQRAWSDGRIVIKQSDAFESFASVIEVSALELDFAREQARFRIDATFGLQRHDFFSDLLRLVRLVGTDLNCTERQ